MSDKPLTKKDKKVFGCLLGCIGVALLLILVASGVAYYFLKFGFASPAPKMDTVATVGTAPVLLVYINADAETAFSPAMLESRDHATYTGTFLRTLLPYEGSFALTHAPESPLVNLGASVSMRRMSEFVVGKLKENQSAMESNGRKVTTLETRGEKNGLAVLEGTLPLPSQADTLRAEAWQGTSAEVPPALERTHFFEATFDNRNGEGAVALSALVQTMGAESESVPFAPAPVVAPASSEITKPLSLLAQVRIIKGLKFIKTGWAALDFTPAGDVDLHLRVSGANEVSAMFLMAGLGRLPEEFNEKVKGLEMTVGGEVTRDGSEIRGELRINGVAKSMRKFMDEYNNRTQPPDWFLKNIGQPTSADARK